tara:strand:- start:992 stop:1837 length:846 start_codon:yes stop_codon:yes gene_type:complete
MKKILVTGSKGFVGRELLFKIKQKNYELIEIGNSKFTNLCDWEVVKKIPKVDVIIHLAAKSFVPDSFKNPLKFYNNNILSTLNILEKAKIDNSKVVFLSTYVYGNPSYLPIDERHKTEPLNPYTQSKLICEDLCSAYFRDFKVPITILRPFNIYGINQNKNFIIPTIISQVNNKEINLNSSNTKRDFIFISDIVDVIIKIVDLDSNLLNIYNLGSGQSVSIKEVVEKILKLTGSQANIKVSNKIRKGEVIDTISDISKIKKDLNWQPKVFIDDGLKLILNN